MKNWFKDVKFNIRNFLAVTFMGGIFVLLTLLLFVEVPPANVEIVNEAIKQMLFVGVAVIIGYYFVSNKNEADRQRHEQSREVPKLPASDYIFKAKDTSLIMSERMDWFRKLQENYPEYAGKRIEDI